MKEVQLTQGKVALVDDDDFEVVSKIKWQATRTGKKWYAKGFTKGSIFTRKTLLMHRLIMNTPIGLDTDHINGDGLDNQRSNLRICTRSQNNANRRILPPNKSGYKGVYWRKKINRYYVSITVNDKEIYIGRYTDIELAARAYDEAARKHFGDFAVLNFP